MVQTRATNKRRQVTQVPSEDGVEHDTEFEPPELDEYSPPAKKRRQNGASSSKKRRGKERGELCQLNLDVLFLIAAYIHPVDLLNLARTCKSLRALLMDKSSEFVWKAARRQVWGLPECPVDLTEPEYANLVFYSRCHGCGKYAKAILWKFRRRYCPDCKITRLCSMTLYDRVIRSRPVLAQEYVTVEGDVQVLVDKEQANTFMEEYNRSSDKQKFISDKEAEYLVICEHAADCEQWKRGLAYQRRRELESLRQQRETSIFDRLKKHGYEREIAHFGRRVIQETRRSLFRTSKPLKDREWDRIWPEWLDTMNNFRTERLERTVYPGRRTSLATEFVKYVANPPPNTPTFDFLPHWTDVARFPPFRDIIYAPEETDTTSAKLFEPAFAQLPEFVDKWKEELEMQLADLIKIVPDTSLTDSAEGQAVAPGDSIVCGTGSSQAATDKLRLACAVFHTSSVFMYPEVLSSMSSKTEHNYGNTVKVDILHIEQRFKIKFLRDAPHIVRACGLDPNVATVEDMDRRNARLKCLSCDSRRRAIWNWRDAMQHAAIHHDDWQLTRDGAFRWEVISDEYRHAILAAEQSEQPFETDTHMYYKRCLLCRPHVGDAFVLQSITQHLDSRHNIKNDDVKEGEHWIPVPSFHASCTLEMTEENGRETFKRASHFYA